MALDGGGEIGSYAAETKEACCALCRGAKRCAGAAFHPTGGAQGCVLRQGPLGLKPNPSGVVCIANPSALVVGGNSHQESNADWVLEQ